MSKHESESPSAENVAARHRLCQMSPWMLPESRRMGIHGTFTTCLADIDRQDRRDMNEPAGTRMAWPL